MIACKWYLRYSSTFLEMCSLASLSRVKDPMRYSQNVLLSLFYMLLQQYSSVYHFLWKVSLRQFSLSFIDSEWPPLPPTFTGKTDRCHTVFINHTAFVFCYLSWPPLLPSPICAKLPPSTVQSLVSCYPAWLTGSISLLPLSQCSIVNPKQQGQRSMSRMSASFLLELGDVLDLMRDEHTFDERGAKKSILLSVLNLNPPVKATLSFAASVWVSNCQLYCLQQRYTYINAYACIQLLEWTLLKTFKQVKP